MVNAFKGCGARQTSVRQSRVTHVEYALFCFLRLHPDTAKTYGIDRCDGNTTIGSMLMQTLEAQGMKAEWYAQLPKTAYRATTLPRAQ